MADSRGFICHIRDLELYKSSAGYDFDGEDGTVYLIDKADKAMGMVVYDKGIIITYPLGENTEYFYTREDIDKTELAQFVVPLPALKANLYCRDDEKYPSAHASPFVAEYTGGNVSYKVEHQDYIAGIQSSSMKFERMELEFAQKPLGDITVEIQPSDDSVQSRTLTLSADDLWVEMPSCDAVYTVSGRFRGDIQGLDSCFAKFVFEVAKIHW